MNVFLFCISSLHKKRSFSLCISFAIVIADLLALTKERLNSKLNFLFNIGTLFGGNAAHEDSQKKKKKNCKGDHRRSHPDVFSKKVFVKGL